jgi:hypothetical protein
MDTRSEIREFLTSRRARLKAGDVGLPDYGTRRVPGLRREEVAVLAGVSVPYYTRLGPPTASSTRSPERSNSTTPSARTSSTLRAPPNPSPPRRAADRPSTAFAPPCSNSWTR